MLRERLPIFIHEWTRIITKKICVRFVKIRGQNEFLKILYGIIYLS
jgi:hypothetical protein